MKKISTAHFLLLLVVVVQIAVPYALAFTGIQFPMVPLLLFSQGSILLPFAIYCIVKRQNPLTLIRMNPISIKSVLLSVLVAFLFYPIATVLNTISMLFVDNAMTGVMNEMMPNGLLTMLLLVAVAPAIAEETVFRGMLYNTYSKRRPVVGIFLSALLFGLMHGNLNQMPYTLFLGIVMALLLEAADSILAPMIMHFTFNGTSVILSWFVGGSSENATSESANLWESIKESYIVSLEETGVEVTEAQLQSMVAGQFITVMGTYLLIALVFGYIVFLIIKKMFHSRGVTMKEVFSEDRSETAYVETKSGALRKNRMIDGYLIAFIIISAGLCVLSLF